jgi:Family of unknown function (DUF6232)
MVDEPIYRSENAIVTAASAVIREQSFPISEIRSASIYDERPKARRWAKIGLAISGACFLFAIITNGYYSSRGYQVQTGLQIGLLPLIGLLMLLFSGGALLIYRFNPRSGIGLVIELFDGWSEAITGLHREELERIRSAIETAKNETKKERNKE